MKIAICTGAYKRPELLDLFCRYYRWLADNTFPFELIVACSEPSALRTAQQYGHTAFMVNNHPLTRKFNMSNQYAEGADYVLNIGSDDFLSPKTLLHYVELFRQGHDYIAPLDWYFFDTKTKHALYWAGYNKPYNIGKACGAGRALSKKLLEKMNWQPWAAGYDRVLDTGMQVNLDKHPHTSHIFRLKDCGLFALDVKTEMNMTKFDRWPNTFEVDINALLSEQMPEWKAAILDF